jgi:hypothetical protein
MKTNRAITFLTLITGLALAAGIRANAQSNSIPSETNYMQFSQFITQRNIFDPSRYPHESRRPRPQYQRPSRAPQFNLVGTMSYEKGNFAFFSGNRDELKEILTVNGTIAGYTVTDITPQSATLRGPDKKDLVLQIGDQMRQENEGWIYVSRNNVTPDVVPTERTTSASGTVTPGNTTTPSTDTDNSDNAAPSANLGSDDVLKRLMQKREQENK